MPRPWPRSLAGQMALLVALALFAAQAINLALILRDRAAFRLAQATRPAAVRIADSLDRETAGRPLRPDRGRVRAMATSPITPAMQSRDDLAAELVTQLAEQNVPQRRVQVSIARIEQLRPHFSRARTHAHGEVIVIAVQQPAGRWLVMTAPWSRGDARLFWRLLAQTLILYVVVLLPVLWVARRISRPLRELATAARDYAPGSSAEPLPLHGPPDVQDVTAAFNALRLRVGAMLDEKDRMLGAIGHDLRTPLAALRVRVESVEDEQDRARMADTIGEMNRTLDDILSLARLGRPSEPATEVDVVALVDAVVEDFRDLGADVRFDDDARVTMRLRPSLTRRAVRNLIENAVKYGGTAEVRIVPQPAAVAITVADHGPGIPPERLEDVFDPFTRLESSRNRDTGGIGLGLALARAIVREARGDITLANRAEGGLEARILLPR
ncbi:sensor histidine kinase [Sphingomonas adhaesiva]|uniref:sensor histidine kinase n=1 Tax=Sphingomonas adhaesiva TaxID=28212 RepID=UPI002FF5A1B0